MDFQKLAQYVIEGDASSAEEWTRKALDSGVDPLEIMNRGLIPGMEVVGQKFSDGEYYLPEMLIAARAMKRCLKDLKPLIAGRKEVSRGRVVIGTVKGDVHDIGKNIVAMMLEGAGFEVYDLGLDVPPEKFVEAVERHQAHILGLSALITTSMPTMKTVIEALQAAGIRERVKVMVGGAPVTEEYAHQIRADGYAPDAGAATEKAKELLGLQTLATVPLA